jgi:hypothetical protein
MNHGDPFLSNSSYHNVKHLDKQHTKSFKKLLTESRIIKTHSLNIQFDFKDRIFSLTESVFAGLEEPKKPK